MDDYHDVIYEVRFINSDGGELLMNGADSDYATDVQGLFDYPQQDIVLSADYEGGAELERRRYLPRQFSMTVGVLAGLGLMPIRNASFNAARDALIAFFAEDELLTLRTEYLGTAGHWDLECIVVAAPLEVKTRTFTVSLIAPRPELRRSIVTTSNQSLPNGAFDNRTFTVTPGGNVRAYPTITITPVTNKATRWNYLREYTVTNNRNVTLLGYPVRLPFDFAWHNTNGRMRPNGEDIRVLVGGQMIDRFWSLPILSATGLWVEVDLPALDSVTVQVIYNNADGGTPAWSNSTEGPMFNLALSTNPAWRYQGGFRTTVNNPGSRSWQWAAHQSPATGMYPIMTHLDAPWIAGPGAGYVNVAGGSVPVAALVQGYAGLSIHHPLGIASVTHSGRTNVDQTSLKFVLRARTLEGAQEDVWTTWSTVPGTLQAYSTRTDTFASEREAVTFALRSGSQHSVDTGPIGAAEDVTLTLTQPVTVSGNSGTGTGGELGVYMLEMTLTNTTLGETLTLFGPIKQVAGVWQSVVIDTIKQIMTMGGQPFYAAYGASPVRRQWFRLAAMRVNSIYWRDVEVGTLNLSISWQDTRL